MAPVLRRTRRDVGTRPFAQREGVKEDDGAEGAFVDTRLWGSYVHGLFGDAGFRRRWLAGLGWRDDGRTPATPDYDGLADAFEAAVPWPRLAALIGVPEVPA